MAEVSAVSVSPTRAVPLMVGRPSGSVLWSAVGRASLICTGSEGFAQVTENVDDRPDLIDV